MKLPATLAAEAVTAIVDTREQCPLDLSPLQMTQGTLTTGDYSARGLESVVAIERKSLPDLIGCVGRDRERFGREVQRLLAFEVRALVVESSWIEIEQGNWRGKITPKQVKSSLISWQVQGLPVVLADHHGRAGHIVAAMLYRSALHRWRELRTMAAEIE